MKSEIKKTIWSNPVGLVIVVVTLAFGAFWFKGLVEQSNARSDQYADGVKTR